MYTELLSVNVFIFKKEICYTLCLYQNVNMIFICVYAIFASGVYVCVCMGVCVCVSVRGREREMLSG